MLARKQVARGFTLVEILIVVVILGILAAIVIPQFTNASESAKSSSLSSQLQTIRSQLELFQVQHNGNYPDLSVASAIDADTNTWNPLTYSPALAGVRCTNRICRPTRPKGRAIGHAVGPRCAHRQSVPVVTPGQCYRSVPGR